MFSSNCKHIFFPLEGINWLTGHNNHFWSVESVAKWIRNNFQMLCLLTCYIIGGRPHSHQFEDCQGNNKKYWQMFTGIDFSAFLMAKILTTYSTCFKATLLLGLTIERQSFPALTTSWSSFVLSLSNALTAPTSNPTSEWFPAHRLSLSSLKPIAFCHIFKAC